MKTSLKMDPKSLLPLWARLSLGAKVGGTTKQNPRAIFLPIPPKAERPKKTDAKAA